MSRPMSREYLTISQAAESLGVSPRTVRRFIKAGKIQAELVPGPFGQEYRIFELPSQYREEKTLDSNPVQTPGQGTVQTIVQAPIQLMEVIRELQERNLSLAAQLGAATERLRNLENQVRLLTTERQPWWKRLLNRKAG